MSVVTDETVQVISIMTVGGQDSTCSGGGAGGRHFWEQVRNGWVEMKNAWMLLCSLMMSRMTEQCTWMMVS